MILPLAVRWFLRLKAHRNPNPRIPPPRAQFTPYRSPSRSPKKHTIMGKVCGSLTRAGEVRGQTPKVAKQDKKKKPDRAHNRMQYNRRFVTADVLSAFGVAFGHEYCESAVDFIARRSHLAFLETDAALKAVPSIIEILAEEHKWDKLKNSWRPSIHQEMLNSMMANTFKKCSSNSFMQG